MDAEEIIAKYIDIRDFIEAKEKEHKEALKPYRQALDTLEGAAALMAQQTGQTSLKSVSGTAFPVDQLRVKCDDKDVFLDFVIDGNRREFLTAHVSKEAVREYMESHEGEVPPGIEIEKFVSWQFRKA